MNENNHVHNQPALSVIIATPDHFQTVRQLVRYLACQTIKERLEMVFVVPSASELGMDRDEVAPFLQYRVVETGPFKSINEARVTGIRKASAPIVVLTEDHCFPAPTWAEALVDAHKGPWAGVGPAVGLANMHSLKAWTSYLIQYAPWMKPIQSGIAEDIPGHNSCYKKDILLEFGDALGPMMDFEYVLHQDLKKKGHELYVEAAAETYHLFMTKTKASIQENFNIGRALAASRARSLSLSKRVLLTLTSPLLPAIRFIRIYKKIRKFGWRKELFPGILPWLILGLKVSAAGEFMGYVFGKGKVQEDILELDFHRDRFVSENEIRRVWSEDLIDFTTISDRPNIQG